jgi:hypothetical protein
MTDPRRRPDDSPNIGTRTLEEEAQGLLGEEMPEDQDAVFSADEIETRRMPTQTEFDEGATASMPEAVSVWTADEVGTVSLDALEDDGLRDGETDDPLVAIEEGQTYVPPSDPPTLPSDDPQGIEVAGGSGVEGAIEPFDDDHRSGDNEDESDVNARVREAIRDDAATSPYADTLEIAVRGSTVILRGTVDDVDDGDLLASVIERVPGIDEVRDETEVAALG